MSPTLRFHPSPNFDDRPPGALVDCIVLHATVLPLDKTLELLCRPGHTASSHYVVAKDGAIFELIPPEKRAWHAGPSEFAGRQHVNDFSVGIEIVNNNDGRDRFTPAQYRAVAFLIHLLRARYGYPIPDDRIVTHAAIARPVGRKSDPIGFDFRRMHLLLASFEAPPPGHRRRSVRI